MDKRSENPTVRAHGTHVYRSHGHFFARVTVSKGKRRSVALSGCASETEAAERAEAIASFVARLRAAKQESLAESIVARAGSASPTELAALSRVVERIVSGALVAERSESVTTDTFRDVAERWTSGRLHDEFPDVVRMKRTSDTDAGRMRKWILPHVGDVPVARFTLAHAPEVMRALPRTLSSASRRQVAQLLSKVLGFAAYPLELIPQSPLPRGFLPRVEQRKARQWIYPDEEAQLLECTAIPLARRMLYGFAHREGMRYRELRRLAWDDLDLERGTVRLDENKTDDPRTWALGPDVVQALVAWRTLLPKSERHGALFQSWGKDGRLAAVYRDDLRLAGVNRAELYTEKPVRKPIRFHDARAAFVTVALATGRSESWVTDRTGHRSSTMLHAYKRAARTAEEVGVGWFRPPHAACPELSAVHPPKTAEETAEEPRLRGDCTE